MVPVEDHSAETESTAIQAQPQVSTGTHRDRIVHIFVSSSYSHYSILYQKHNLYKYFRQSFAGDRCINYTRMLDQMQKRFTF